MKIHGICNLCGRVAHKREREHGWALIQIGVTQLQMHHECAHRYRDDGLLPSATFPAPKCGAVATIERREKRQYPQGKLWFSAPREGVPLNFN